MKVAVIPVVFDVLGTTHKRLLGCLEELEIEGLAETIQTTV